jgi:hypothetical protein
MFGQVCLIGFIHNGGRRCCINMYDGDPEHTGNDLARFIVSHTAEELQKLKTMIDKVSLVAI